MSSTLLSEMTWPDVKLAVDQGRIVIIPVGATEQHGPQLPLDTDIVNSFEIAKAAAERTGSLVAPPVYYGISPHWMGFPVGGTIRKLPVAMPMARCRATPPLHMTY